MGFFVQQTPLGRAQVLRPQLFQMNQRPLAPAEGEVLQSGQLQPLLLRPGRSAGHPRRVQVTPAGSASATVTV